MGFIYGQPNFAPGHNNPDNLLPIWRIDYPAFLIYREHISVKYFPNEGTEESGAGRLKPIGLPNWKLTIQNMIIFDYISFNTIIMLGQENDALITAHLPETKTNVWKNWNCTIKLPNDFWDKFNEAEFRDVELIIDSGVEI